MRDLVLSKQVQFALGFEGESRNGVIVNVIFIFLELFVLLL